MTNFSFGRTDGRTERGNNDIPELSLESAGITRKQKNDNSYKIISFSARPHHAISCLNNYTIPFRINVSNNN